MKTVGYMKLWLIRFIKVDWDEYAGFVVSASSI